MPLIFLSENNSLSKKALQAPFPQKTVTLFEIPFKKMRKRASASFKDRLKKSGALVFSEPSLSKLIPERETDDKAFFDSVIIKILYLAAKRKNISSNRLVIFNPTESLAFSAVNLFPDLALSGENALSLSNRIFESTGAPIPVVSGSKDTDIVLCSGEYSYVPAIFISGYDIASCENALGGDALKFYPKEEYSELVTFLERPLSLKEAALLSEYDKKATFNIAF